MPKESIVRTVNFRKTNEGGYAFTLGGKKGTLKVDTHPVARWKMGYILWEDGSGRNGRRKMTGRNWIGTQKMLELAETKFGIVPEEGAKAFPVSKASRSRLREGVPAVVLTSLSIATTTATPQIVEMDGREGFYYTVVIDDSKNPEKQRSAEVFVRRNDSPSSVLRKFATALRSEVEAQVS